MAESVPQWIYGMSTTAWIDQLLAGLREGRWQLKRLRLDGRIEAVNQPFDDLAGLATRDGRAVAVASNDRTGAGLLELICARRSQPVDHPNGPSRAAPRRSAWQSRSGSPLQRSAHPCLVLPQRWQQRCRFAADRSHSGQTAWPPRSQPGHRVLDSRGWGGGCELRRLHRFGRAYRERLNGGQVDVTDCSPQPGL